MKKLFDPEKTPKPDVNGFFTHPDYPCSDDNQVNSELLLLMMGYHSKFVTCDDLEAIAYEGGNINGEYIGAKNWTPVPNVTFPDQWQLISVYDNEEGLVAVFVIPTLLDRFNLDTVIDRLMTKEVSMLMLHNMKQAMRTKGKFGWWLPATETSDEYLEEKLQAAKEKGQWIDVANYAAMLEMRKRYTSLLPH